MKTLVTLLCVFLFGCSTTKYQQTPTLCPEPPQISLPEPPSAVTDEPVAENFLGRLIKQFGDGDGVKK